MDCTRACCSQQNDCIQHDEQYHVATYDVETPDGPKQIWVFPREPHWWRDDGAEDRRQEVFRNFEPTDITLLIDEVAMYVQSPPQTSDECAQLIRRLLSLSWMSDVCRGSLDYLPEGATTDYHVHYWQQRAARYLIDVAWQRTVTLSVARLSAGVQYAVTTIYEMSDVDG